MPRSRAAGIRPGGQALVCRPQSLTGSRSSHDGPSQGKRGADNPRVRIVLQKPGFHGSDCLIDRRPSREVEHEALVRSVGWSDLDPQIPAIDMNSHHLGDPRPGPVIDSTLVQGATPPVHQTPPISGVVPRQLRKSHLVVLARWRFIRDATTSLEQICAANVFDNPHLRIITRAARPL